MIYHKYLNTPLGEMIVCATDIGICLLEFTDRKHYEKQLNNLKSSLDTELADEINSHIELLENELKDYFLGNLTNFTVTLDMIGTDFQKQVWHQLIAIPHGKTTTYQKQALAMGKPKSVRAVANANGMNKIAIIIPCHRVVGSNGKLTGYAGGLGRKEWLINHERKEQSLF